ncbi:hypothetical protein [Spirosoma rhododendri]|uniref:Lipocalin-like domain-containing protein n=1 Tax=Spirosoma rhododendri TaxID=2728024 RepID=A0A7L5DV96_9BACT|nr:hypothetical protein [Spirosoma rhododendri]QJD79867.1 hypothetical protein HH216_16675 [Spirosoma rhododendri]
MITPRFSAYTLRLLAVALLFLAFTTGCNKDDNNPTSQTGLLVANNWQVSNVTTTDGQTINQSRLNLATSVLFSLSMQFRNDNTVRALDPKQSNQVINQGTWKLASDNQSMDVVVTGFNGNFPIVQLNRSTLILRQQAPVDGKTTPINLEFKPVL